MLRHYLAQPECAMPPGPYPFDIIVEGGSGRMSARVYLTVTMPLGESGPGTDYGRFSTNTIEVRKGGPSTLTLGPYMVLSFCDSPQPRRLKATLRSVVSDAGLFMDRPIRFSLFQLLTWPLPQTLQTVGGAYRANANQVATSTEWQLEWPMRGGVYILTFDQSPLERNAPPMQRPGVILVSIDVR